MLIRPPPPPPNRCSRSGDGPVPQIQILTRSQRAIAILDGALERGIYSASTCQLLPSVSYYLPNALRLSLVTGIA